MFLLVTLLGLTAPSGTVSLSPSHTIEDPGQQWSSVSWSPSANAWLIGGRDSIYRYRGNGVPPDTLVTEPGKALIETPVAIAEKDGRIFAFDGKNLQLTRLHIGHREPGPVIDLPRLGGLPFACLAWNGRGWLLAGRLWTPGAAKAEAIEAFQLREGEDLTRRVSGTAVSPEETFLLRAFLPFGGCATHRDETLVALYPLSSAFVLDVAGSIIRRIPLQIPEGARISVSQSDAPKSPASYGSALRGKAVPVGVGWVAGVPAVLLASLGSGASALTWRTYPQGGQPTKEIRLSVPSRYPRDLFLSAYVDTASSGTLLILAIPFSERGAAKTRSLYEFCMPK